MSDLERIEAKLDKINSKLDSHLERIAKVETAHGYIKTGLGFVISALSALFVKLFMER